MTGAKLREYYLAKGLGERGGLVHLFFAGAGDPAQGADAAFPRKAVAVPAPRRYTPAKIARGIFGRWPLPVVNYTSEEMRAALAAALAAERFDLAHIDSIHMAAYASMLPRGLPVVYDWHNIESELMRRYGARAGFLRSAYAAATARRLAALERRILRAAFGHIVCSERERDELRRVAPEARIAVVENGVDTRYFQPGGGERGRWRVVFVGSMNYHANVEAAVWFAHAVWPAVRERFPGWTLTVVGSDPAPAVLALRGEKSVEVTGSVPDVRPYYREAVAAVAPLHTGGGTRLKILEAMAAGAPVVSTPLGAEGLAVAPGGNILIADGPADWVACLAELADRPEVWGRIAQAGLELVRARYDWGLLGQSLHDTYCGWISSPARV